MHDSSTERFPVDLRHTLILVAVVVALCAAFVLASEMVLILFLGVLFSVFLTKLANWTNTWVKAGYQGSLAIVVFTLLLTVVGASTFFFSQLNRQLDEASGKVDEGLSELRRLIDEYPALKTTIASAPLISSNLELEAKQSDDRAKKMGRKIISQIRQPIMACNSTAFPNR